MAEIVVLSLTAAKEWLKMDLEYTLEDALLNSIIASAIEYCEKYTGLTFGLKSLQSYSSKSVHELPGCPVWDVTSVKDLQGNYVQYNRKGFQYPTLYFSCDQDVITTYTAGFGHNLPEGLRTAVKMMVATLYENRESYVIGSRGDSLIELPLGVTDLLRPYSRSGGLFI